MPMKSLAERLALIEESSTLAIAQKAQQMKKQGIDVISFSAGEPEFATPAHIVDACCASMKRGETGYPPIPGVLPLREAVCAKLRADNGLEYAPDDIIVTCGAKQSLYNAFAVLLDPGDEVLVPAPYWVSYPAQIRLNGGVPKIVPTSDADDFNLSRQALDAHTTERTKAIVFSSPSNPAGTCYDEATLRAIAEWAEAANAYIISDEIYEKLVFEGQFRSILNVAPAVKARTIIVNGLSKAYAMTGWRVGYTASNRAIATAMKKVQGHLNTNTATFVQHAAIAALTGPQDFLAQMHAAYDKRRQFMTQQLRALPGVTVPTPSGAFYCFPNVSAWYGRTIRGRMIRHSLDFAAACLEDAKVAVVPGDAFGADAHVRMSYACSDADIETGCRRLAEWLAGA